MHRVWGVGLGIIVVVWGSSCGRGLRPHSSAGGLEAQSSFVNFGAVLAGSSSDGTIYLRNLGTQPVAGLGASVAGSVFSLKGGAFPGTGGDCSSVLSAGSTCSVVLSFTPPRSGSQLASLLVSGATRAEISVGLLGAGLGGGVDSTFGGSGIALTSVGSFFNAYETVTLQADGKILATGHKGSNATADVVIARYLSDGSLDTSFASGGIRVDTLSGQEDVSVVTLLQTDGKIVSAGYSNALDSMVMRYNTDGSLDTTFATGGVFAQDLGAGQLDRIQDAVIQADGKILATGNRGASPRVFVIRLSTDGVLDATFGVAGMSTLLVGTGAYGKAIALQTDGKIVIGGEATIGGQFDSIVARFLTDGALDSSFNGTGFVTTAVGTGSEVASDVAIQGDGKILLGGYFSKAIGEGWSVTRYLTDGSLDSTFDFDGIRTLPTLSSTGQERLHALALQSDAKILAAGTASIITTSNGTVARLLTDGSLDSSFGTDGMHYSRISTVGSAFQGVGFDSAGNIVASGYTGIDGVNWAPIVVRLLP